MKQRRIRFDQPFDVGVSLRNVTPHHLIRTGSSARGWWTGRNEAGLVSLQVVVGGGWIEATAWGPGADDTLERLGALCGIDDDPERFRPPPGVVADLHRRFPGLRLGKTGQVFAALLPVILAQKVTGVAAGRSYAAIAAAYGDPAPGPVDGWIAPDAAVVAGLTPEELHRFGVERKRAGTVIEAGRRARRLEEATGMDRDAAWRRLTAVRGIGLWTAGHVMAFAVGDPDAVPVGDYHLPNLVSWVLAGEARGDDDRMLELLEPYRPHRRRTLALLRLSGAHAPRYGPRVAVEDFSRR